jgi:Fur family ferric uptake transcriptional regulator
MDAKFGKETSSAPSGTRPKETSVQPQGLAELSLLRNAGLNPTLPRLQVLEFIRASSLRHLSAEQIYRGLVQQRAERALGTIYRSLSELERVGLLSRSVFGVHGAVFELADRPEHDHLVCLRCGRVQEFRDAFLEIRHAEVAARRGFVLIRHRLVLHGYCRGCISSSRTL